MEIPITPRRFSSSLENIFKYFPKDHENAFRQGIYNLLFIFAFFLLIFSSYFVLAILEPFLFPILWAVLSGFVLHPYKIICTENLKFLCNVSDPLPIAATKKIAVFLDKAAELIGNYLIQNLKLFLLGTLLFVFSYLFIQSSSLTSICLALFSATSWFAKLFHSWNYFEIINGYHLIILGGIYGFSLHFLWHPENNNVFSISAFVYWFLIGVYICNHLWSPLYYLLLFGLLIIFLFGKSENGKFKSLAFYILNSFTTKKQDTKKERSSRFSEQNVKSSSDGIIETVAWCCALLQIWLYPQLLHLLPLPLSYYILKRLLIYFGLAGPLEEWSSEMILKLKDWINKRRFVIFPSPIRYFLEAYQITEKKALKYFPEHADEIVSVFLIFALITFIVIAAIFVSFQLYYESVYILSTSGKLVASLSNTTLFQQLNASFSLESSGLEDIIEGGYRHGRAYISSTLQEFVSNEDIEKKVLELWDRTYQYWLSSHSDIIGPNIDGDALTSSVEDVVNIFQAQGFNFSSLSQFIKDNMGTLTSILDHSWNLLKGNFLFISSVLLDVIRVLLQSGSGFINFIFGVIVYFTALFYLLLYSGRTYKPVELLSIIGGRVFGNGFGVALNKAVTSVFNLTVKMALFYGMWTYLTHILFKASIVMVPVLAATFLAAVPVAGQYLIPLPAALELCISEDRWIAATFLVLCHIAPMWFVDASIYSDIKGGIHPWITGLSIVGGIYCFGILGAIYGPLLLCAIFVVISMYQGILSELPSTPRSETNYKRSDSVV